MRLDLSLFVVVGGSSLAFAACSSSPRQLIFPYAQYLPATRVFRHISPGIGLRAGGELDGLDVGWSDVVVAYPSNAGTATEGSGHAVDPAGGARSGWTWPFGWAWQATDGSWRWLGLALVPRPGRADECRFVARTTLGAGVGLSELFLGVDVGITRTTTVAADRDASGHYRLEYSSAEPMRCRLTRIEGGKQ